MAAEIWWRLGCFVGVLALMPLWERAQPKRQALASGSVGQPILALWSSTPSLYACLSQPAQLALYGRKAIVLAYYSK